MTYDPMEARKEQDKFCEARGWPNYSELYADHDGRCCFCGRNIYDTGGYSVEYATTHLITGCPFCSRTYLD